MGWMLNSRSSRKLFALEDLYQLKNSGTRMLSRFPYLKKYAKDFLFCSSNYPFLLSVSYFSALNIVHFHQRSLPSDFLCRLYLFVNHSFSVTKRKCRHSAPCSRMCGINSTYWFRIWNKKSNEQVFWIRLTVYSYSWYMVNRKHPTLEDVRLWWAVCYGLLRLS